MVDEENPLSRFMRDRAVSVGNRQEPYEHLGEVISSSTTEIIAQASQLHQAPPFGQFIRIDSEVAIVGIVYNVFTHSIEANRRPTAYGKSEEQLRMEQPQIFELLRTEFQALVIGYFEGERAVQILPSQPARIHSFVHLCDVKQIRLFTETNDYLRRILDTSNVPTDELLIASLRKTLSAHNGDQAYLVRVGKELSRLLGDDYDRLSSIVRRSRY